ncbi:SRPBCC domain-containing protein [Rhizobacter sp. Root1221]|uniref:SRPBCC domain-containing protein n=1 Tax=Rhizobacter sp. Root1221 TaxID=1736433 RepID=UPI000A7ADB8A|nr:SRPBCC domain-containing protein [Rhizobacter sp. Root1221]
MTDTTVTVTHRFDVPADRVFDAWLDPAWIGRWMFGPGVRDERICHLTLDPRVGGRFSFEVERQGQVLDHVGEYLEIVRPGRLVFTWGVAGTASSRVTVTVADSPGGCELTLLHEIPAEWADFAQRTRAGWDFMLSTLDRELHPVDGHVHPVSASTVRMERLLPGPAERVWEFLTDPDKRALWLAGGPMELRLGGAVELHFRHADLSPVKVPTPEAYRAMEAGHVLRGTVTQIDPLHRLGFTWGPGPAASEVMFELVPQGNLVRLVLTHTRLADSAELRSVSGGWHTHADILEDRLRGQVPEAFWTRHAVIEAMYRQRERNG